MTTFLDAVKKRVMIIDGAMGTLLMEAGVRPDDGFDLQNLKRPNIIKSIHKRYIDAGADIIETNTFGANRIKLKDYEAQDKVVEINTAAVKIAREAGQNDAFVCGSIGPLGKILMPLGDLPFNVAVEAFAEQAKALSDAGCHGICIETISDLQEMRAAIIGAKSSTSIPIIASLTYDENGTTVFGTPPEAAVVVLEALDVDVISANCSTGPEGVLKISRKLLAASRKPIMVMPNAGMPVIEDDKAIYKMTPEQFAKHALKFLNEGVSIIGGCCGTTPAHIKAVREAIPRGTKKKTIAHKAPATSFASRFIVSTVDKNKFFAVGERINPTGRKVLREEIKSGNFNIIRDEAVAQTKAKANLLDVNVSVPEGNDPENMTKAVTIIQSASNLPLSIDSSNPTAIEAGLSEFCGKALLNSVSGKTESLEKILPLAKKYGSAVIGLTLDDHGIPKTALERFKIAENIIIAAEKIGIASENIFIDTLVMSAAVSFDDSLEALKVIPLIKNEFKVKTILGVSNISHGLPNRSKINALFLRLARLYGLDAGIVDPLDREMAKAIKSKPLFNNEKEKHKLAELIKKEIEKSKKLGKPKVKPYKIKELKFKNLKDIEDAVILGDTEKVKAFVVQALEKGVNPQKIIDEALTQGMEIVGEKFSKKIYFLPQVLASAESMSAGFALCKEKIPHKETKYIGKVLIATVFGDIHDIGKNIVKMMLENHGFKVIDLGKDVPTHKIIEAAIKEKPNAIALSALLTTTMLEMKSVKAELEKAGLDIPIIVGGAVVTEDYAQKINALYGADAAQSVKLAKQIISQLH